jgi:uncharacterized protein YciW
VTDPITEAVDAVQAMRDYDRAVGKARQRRDRAWRWARRSGMQPKQIADAMMQRLLEAGWAKDDVAKVGVSYANVKARVAGAPLD